MDSFELGPGILDEIVRACQQNPIVLSRLAGFLEGKGMSERDTFRLELKGRLVLTPSPKLAGKNGQRSQV